MKVIPDTRPFKLINTPSLIYIYFKSDTSVQKLFPPTYSLMAGMWFSLVTLVPSIITTTLQDITETLLNVVFNTRTSS